MAWLDSLRQQLFFDNSTQRREEPKYVTEDPELKEALVRSKKEFIKKIHADMDEYLSSIGFILKDVPSDGNCFFHAVRDQLRLRKGKEYTIEELRSEAACYIIEHPQEFEHIVTALSFGNSEKYLQKLFENKEWADNLIIVGLAKAFNLQVFIVQDDHHTYSINDEGNTTIYLGYYRNLHYVSLHGEHLKNEFKKQPTTAI